MPKEDWVKGVTKQEISLGFLPTERTLGVCWDSQKDTLGIQIKEKEPVCTRRAVLSIMSSVYDPLGLVCPYVLLAKKIFQDECRRKLGWDEPLTDENCVRWLKWLKDLPDLQKFNVERCLIPNCAEKFVEFELHHFCDASTEAYGCVSYLRMKNESGQVHCSFLQAKSRLAPIKSLTIPRLELQGAVLAVKADQMLRSQLKIDVARSVFWTDSTIVIHYIHNTSRRFQTFVANRVAAIHEGSEPAQWRHVPSDMNPGDDASRGLDAEEMVNSKRWKQGPDFLWQSESTWPNLPSINSELLDGDKEVKQKVKVFTTTVDEDADWFEKFVERYSCWYRLRKAVAWLRRFINWLCEKKQQRLKHSLEVEELDGAERVIIANIQKKHYKSELKALESRAQVPKSSSIYKLDVCLVGGIIRLKGRLTNASVSEFTKHPAVLPKEHHVSYLIARYVHEKQSGHSGRDFILSKVRQKYWIPGVRPVIRKILQECVLCKWLRGIPEEQRMADLPVDRVTPFDSPFSAVGVDCFGPYSVKRGRSHEKRYGCIFTCLNSRAVHIEKVNPTHSSMHL